MMPFRTLHGSAPLQQRAKGLVKRWWSGDPDGATEALNDALARAPSAMQLRVQDMRAVVAPFRCTEEDLLPIRQDFFRRFVWYTLADLHIDPEELADINALSDALWLGDEHGQPILDECLAVVKRRLASTGGRRVIAPPATTPSVPPPPRLFTVTAEVVHDTEPTSPWTETRDQDLVDEQTELDQEAVDDCEREGFRLGGGTIKQKRYAARIVKDLVLDTTLSKLEFGDEEHEACWAYLQKRSAKWWIDQGQTIDLDEHVATWIADFAARKPESGANAP
jgi:hypothetical protein